MSQSDEESSWTTQSVPLHALQFPLRDIFVTVSLVVMGQVDTERMKIAMYELINRWPILAARLQPAKGRNVNVLIPTGPLKIDHHPPWVSFQVTSDSHAFPKEQSQTCSPDPQPSIKLDTGDSIPDCLDSYVSKGANQPTMYIFVKQYNDVAVVQLTTPHVLYDMLGISQILHQWCDLMQPDTNVSSKTASHLPTVLLDADEGQAVPLYPPKGSDGRKRLNELTQSMKSPLRVWSKVDQLKYVVRFIPEFVAYPTEVKHSIFVPTDYISRIRQESQQNGSVWISENDVVTAVQCKLNLFRFQRKSKKMYTIAFTMNMRGYMKGHPSTKHNAEEIWLGNSTVPGILKTHRIAKWRSMSVMDIAREVRSAIEEQRTPDQMARACMMLRESGRRATYPAYHPPNHTSFYSSSWAAANLFDLSFSSASGEKTRLDNEDDRPSTDLSRSCKVVRVDGYSAAPNTPHRTWGIIVGRQERWSDPEQHSAFDGPAGYWIIQAARKGAWPQMNAWIRNNLWAEEMKDS